MRKHIATVEDEPTQHEHHLKLTGVNRTVRETRGFNL